MNAAGRLLRKAARYRPYRVARAALTRPTGAKGRRHVVVLLAGLLAIVLWQASFAAPQAAVDNSFKVTAASGVHYDARFTYFLYYLNLFPVVSMTSNACASDTQPGCWDTAGGTPAAYNYEAAKNHLNAHGKSLQQDIGWTWYAGDRGKVYLYWFDAWLKGAPWNPSPRPASRLAFIVALCALFGSAWWVRRPALGGLLVLFLGSNPFQLYEINGRENVFGWNISIAILLLAIHLPLLRRWYRPHPGWVFVWPVAVGLLMATLRTVRSEPMPMLLAAAGTYAFAVGLTKARRLALVGVLAVSFWLGGTYWNRHFVRKHNEAAQVVATLGGHPFPTDIRLYHHVWHPIWCGLGDFGQKYGYSWNDHHAAAFAQPFMEAKGIYVPSGVFYGASDPREYLDPETKIYKKLPYDLPTYNDIIRDKILHDIWHDPAWYAGVLLKRVNRIFTMTTPIRVTWAKGWLTLPWQAYLVVPLALVLLLTRSRFLLGITLFTLPSITTALIVFSDLGITYYGIFHIVGFAVVTSILLDHALHWGTRFIKRSRANEGGGAPSRPKPEETTGEPSADAVDG